MSAPPGGLALETMRPILVVIEMRMLLGKKVVISKQLR